MTEKKKGEAKNFCIIDQFHNRKNPALNSKVKETGHFYFACEKRATKLKVPGKAASRWKISWER